MGANGPLDPCLSPYPPAFRPTRPVQFTTSTELASMMHAAVGSRIRELRGIDFQPERAQRAFQFRQLTWQPHAARAREEVDLFGILGAADAGHDEDAETDE